MSLARHAERSCCCQSMLELRTTVEEDMVPTLEEPAGRREVRCDKCVCELMEEGPPDVVHQGEGTLSTDAG